MRTLSTAAGIALCALLTTPIHAQRGGSVARQAPPPPAVTPALPVYPYPPILLPRVRPAIRCEQDRPIGDMSPCGEETAEPVVVADDRDATLVAIPKKLKRCEQDRPVGDPSPCERK